MAEYNLEEVWIYSRYGFDISCYDSVADETAENEYSGMEMFGERLQEAGIRIVSLKKALADGILPK